MFTDPAIPIVGDVFFHFEREALDDYVGTWNDGSASHVGNRDTKITACP